VFFLSIATGTVHNALVDYLVLEGLAFTAASLYIAETGQRLMASRHRPAFA